MNYILTFKGSIDSPHIHDHEAHLTKTMEACFHLLWGFEVNVDPAHCTFRPETYQTPKEDV